MQELREWESFYVIVGSGAGALIGLQFVVMTLVAERPPPRAEEAGAAFATPSIIHFSTVLLLSALLCAPWQSLAPAAVTWGLAGLAGVLYTGVVARRMRRQSAYKPEFEDWLFHTWLPLTVYLLLAIAALAASGSPRGALFTVGGAALLMLFVGIHNAWDSVTYHIFVTRKDAKAGKH